MLKEREIQEKRSIENAKIALKERETQEQKVMFEKKLESDTKGKIASLMANLEKTKLRNIQERYLSHLNHQQGLENKEIDHRHQIEFKNGEYSFLSIENEKDRKHKSKLHQSSLQNEKEILEFKLSHDMQVVRENNSHDLQKQINTFMQESNLRRMQNEHELDLLEEERKTYAHNAVVDIQKKAAFEEIDTKAHYSRKMIDAEHHRITTTIDTHAYKEKTYADISKLAVQKMLEMKATWTNAEAEAWLYEEKAKIDEKRKTPKQEEIENIFKKEWKFWKK